MNARGVRGWGAPVDVVPLTGDLLAARLSEAQGSVEGEPASRSKSPRQVLRPEAAAVKPAETSCHDIVAGDGTASTEAA